jgi:hypothetical protein
MAGDDLGGASQPAFLGDPGSRESLCIYLTLYSYQVFGEILQSTSHQQNRLSLDLVKAESYDAA